MMKNKIFNFTFMPKLVVFEEEENDPIPMPLSAIINQTYQFNAIPIWLNNRVEEEEKQKMMKNLPEMFHHKRILGVLICVQYTQIYTA